MNLNTVASLATKFYKSGKCYYFTSAPGRGKTTTVVEAAPRIGRELGMNFGLVVISGPNLTPGDTVGFGLPKHNDGYSEMIFSSPFWWRTDEGKRLEEYDGGIIFVDEADKMDTDIKKVMGEMALSGRCGPHQLPPGWVVWMAGNRFGLDRSGSSKELDHLINRRVEIAITDDLASWELWATRHNVRPEIIAFAVQNPHIVFPDKAPEKQGPFCTPRSIVAAGEILEALAEGDQLPASDTAVEVVAGAIGAAASAQLFAMIKLANELPSLEEIIRNPDKASVPTKPDGQMLASYSLAARTAKDNLIPLITYIERLSADFASVYCKAVLQRLPILIMEPAMRDWVKRNQSLIHLMNAVK